MSLALALKTGDPSRLPSRRDEDWRWTDLRGLIRAIPPESPAFVGDVGAGPFDALADGSVVIVNGWVREGEPAPETGVLALRFVSHADATAHDADFAVTVAPGQTLTVLESYEGQGLGGYLTNIGLDFSVGEGARLERIVLVDDLADAVTVSTAEVSLAPGATFNQTVLTSGARRQRLETRVSHPGAHAQARLDGVYLLDGQRHADLTTIVTHAGVDGVTSQLTKGMVTDQARGVFQGRIVVSPGADQTDARMGHHALILSDKAEVDAKPELLIFADDVSCAHGNTIGALDENALFYAEQRGIPQAEAKAMLTLAFVGEVVDRIEHEGAREIAAAWVARKLGSAE
ncbi:Fe-S cluster assembly protein SufD [Caulobacter sp.]|uniref:Fe-S cluster assembly protein SufD n=1 Tax=Caulobacter sp. TaxID=78 RepID=UPI002B49CA6B|nr:Fe-S cluster assembly protein SufD [Caulobacter sp.]HJV42371.1 Fe-S cluster assembly protein SufD [Caulobacter sp.]